MGEEHDLSTVLLWKGSSLLDASLSTTVVENCGDSYTDVYDFTNYLGADHPLSLEKLTAAKWVFWSPEAYQKSPIIQNKIKALVSQEISNTVLTIFCPWEAGLTQFWAPKVVGKIRYLTTSDQPFAVDGLYKGMCRYRKHCMDHGDIFVGDGANEEHLGAVGRVYLNGHPETSPDLRLYSTNELPLRDYAARRGARSYFVVPIFDMLDKECYGVLEYLDFRNAWMGIPVYMETLERALQKAELRTTHLKTDQTEFGEPENLIEGATELVAELQMTRYEIRKMLQAAKEMVPQLHMAQVWTPCKQCANTTTAFCCMELVGSIKRNQDDYLDASRIHRLQPQKGIIAKTMMSSSNIKSCFCQNICDFSQSENPLAHYAQKSRLSFCFAICLESLHNSDDLYYLEFFLQPNSRNDLHGVSLCHLLIGVMEMNLKSFKVTSSDIFEVREDITSNSIELVPHKTSGILEGGKHEENILTMMNRRWEMFPSELEFLKYLQMDDQFSCFKSQTIFMTTWLYWCRETEELCGIEENYSSFLQNSTPETILLHNLISSINNALLFRLVQFWAPEIDEKRCYLTTSGQPFALFDLHEDLAFFRKLSMKHQYFVDEGVKDEELGPIGRVFRSGHHEMTHDSRLYSTTEFPLKNAAAFCDLTSYIAFPVFDQKHKCLGVLEFMGDVEHFDDTALRDIQIAVKEACLSSTHIQNEPKFHGEFALSEIKYALELVKNIAQLHAAEVWVPNNDCSNTNNSLTCMQRVVSNWHTGVQLDAFETGKGIIGMVLASENKCCYCKNSCQFSITEQSRPHRAQRKRLDVWFAICLLSSHTGDIPFVLNFFLTQGPGNYEYLWSFLYYLLPILKQELKSFKVATGKQLGYQLVVDIIEFSNEGNQPTSLQFGQPNMFPVKFKIVQYGQQKHKQFNYQEVNEMDNVTSAVAQGNQGTTLVTNLEEDEETSKRIEKGKMENQCTTLVINLEEEEEETSRRIEKGKMRTGLRITLEDIKGQFGKRREDAAKNLSVSISTFKRACRFHNIHRWPSSKKHRKNPSLYMTKDANAYSGDP